MSEVPEDVEPIKVAWKVYALGATIASVRYRCLLPAIGLSTRNVQQTVLEEGETLRDPACFDVLVFVKSFTEGDLQLARRAVAAGVPVILDLCDHILVDGYATNTMLGTAARLREMAALASMLVVSTEPLKAAMRDALGVPVSMCVIPDQVETWPSVKRLMSSDPRTLFGPRADVVPAMVATLPAPVRRVADMLVPLLAAGDPNSLRARTYRAVLKAPSMRRILRQRVDRIVRPAKKGSSKGKVFAQLATPAVPVETGTAGRKRVLWFGIHGAAHSSFGIASLEDLLETLEAVNRVVPIELRVVSNSLPKFEALAAAASFPASYAQWTLDGIFHELAASHVCVLPNPRDTFSICKSANRALLALSNGVPVVATGIPSFLPLSECLVLDEWYEGLKGYLSDDALRAAHLARAQKVIRETYSGEVIAQAWLEVLGAAIVAGRRARPKHPARRAATVS